MLEVIGKNRVTYNKHATIFLLVTQNGELCPEMLLFVGEGAVCIQLFIVIQWNSISGHTGLLDHQKKTLVTS